jgi:ankyrin repeat protein
MKSIIYLFILTTSCNLAASEFQDINLCIEKDCQFYISYICSFADCSYGPINEQKARIRVGHYFILYRKIEEHKISNNTDEAKSLFHSHYKDTCHIASVYDLYEITLEKLKKIYGDNTIINYYYSENIISYNAKEIYKNFWEQPQIQPFHDNTPLMIACMLGNVYGVKAMVADGVEIDRQDYSGNSAFHYAAMFGHEECALILEKAGANANIKNKEGNSVIYYAKKNRLYELIKELKK